MGAFSLDLTENCYTKHRAPRAVSSLPSTSSSRRWFSRTRRGGGPRRRGDAVSLFLVPVRRPNFRRRRRAACNTRRCQQRRQCCRCSRRGRSEGRRRVDSAPRRVGGPRGRGRRGRGRRVGEQDGAAAVGALRAAGAHGVPEGACGDGETDTEQTEIQTIDVDCLKYAKKFSALRNELEGVTQTLALTPTPHPADSILCPMYLPMGKSCHAY